MNKIVETKVDELIAEEKMMDEFFTSMVDELRKMDIMAYTLRQKINHEDEKITRPEKTLLIGQLRMLNDTIAQLKENISYFRNDKCSEISEKIYAEMKK